MFISVSILIYFHSSFSLVYCLVALFTPGVSAYRQTIGEVSLSALGCLNDEAFRHLLTFPTNYLGQNGVIQSSGVSTLQNFRIIFSKKLFQALAISCVQLIISNNWPQVCYLFIHLVLNG